MTDSDTQLLSIDEINKNLGKVKRWSLSDNGKSITRNFKLKDFKEAIDLVNKIAEIAEEKNHHPDIRIHGYNNLEVGLSTHSAGGLTQIDFSVAENIENLKN